MRSLTIKIGVQRSHNVRAERKKCCCSSPSKVMSTRLNRAGRIPGLVVFCDNDEEGKLRQDMYYAYVTCSSLQEGGHEDLPGNNCKTKDGCSRIIWFGLDSLLEPGSMKVSIRLQSSSRVQIVGSDSLGAVIPSRKLSRKIDSNFNGSCYQSRVSLFTPNVDAVVDLYLMPYLPYLFLHANHHEYVECT